MTETLGDRLDAIQVRVRAPGAAIEAELRHRRQISISLDEGCYAFLREPQLERALAGLARLLYTGWVRQYRAALTDTAIDPVEDPDFVAGRAKIETTGRSADGRITITAVGIDDFQVRVAPGTLRELSERQFVTAVHQATNGFLADQAAKISELRMALAQRG